MVCRILGAKGTLVSIYLYGIIFVDLYMSIILAMLRSWKISGRESKEGDNAFARQVISHHQLFMSQYARGYV